MGMISHVGVLQTKKETGIPLFLFAATILSRIPFRSRVLYHWDSVQYALATEHYDISVHQPHTPGYFIYVMLGKLLNTITRDANTSFVILSILASGALVVAVYALAKRMFNEKTALAASLLAMTSPIVWFHGEVALNYILEGFLSTLTAYYCWRTLTGEKKTIIAASLLLAFATGIRQTMLMFLLPLWILSLVKVPSRYRLYAFALLASGILFWFLPMISLTGGYMKYRQASQEYFTYVIAPVLNSETSTFFYFLKTVVLFTLHGLGLAAAFLLFYFRSRSLKQQKNDLLSLKGLFFVLWTSPPILFYVLVTVTETNPGYSLIYLPAFIILAANALAITVVTNKTLPKWFFKAGISVVLIFNSYMFSYSNSSFTYAFLKTQEEGLDSFVREVRERFSPENTIILARHYVFFGPRHFMYYLPEFRVYIINDKIPKQTIKRNTLWGRHHITYMADGVHIPDGTKYFISPVEINKVNLEAPIPCEQIVSGVVFADGDEFRFCLYDINFAPVLYPEREFAGEEYNAPK